MEGGPLVGCFCDGAAAAGRLSRGGGEAVAGGGLCTELEEVKGRHVLARLDELFCLFEPSGGREGGRKGGREEGREGGREGGRKGGSEFS